MAKGQLDAYLTLIAIGRFFRIYGQHSVAARPANLQVNRVFKGHMQFDKALEMPVNGKQYIWATAVQ